MAYLSRSALVLLLVVTPGIAMAIPLPPMTPPISGAPTAAGGPRRPQVFQPSDGESRLGRADVGGPRRPGAPAPQG
jgi:hypothetical protein